MTSLEHQLVNIRHLQHHAASLSSRPRRESAISIHPKRQQKVTEKLAPNPIDFHHI